VLLQCYQMLVLHVTRVKHMRVLTRLTGRFWSQSLRRHPLRPSLPAGHSKLRSAEPTRTHRQPTRSWSPTWYRRAAVSSSWSGAGSALFPPKSASNAFLSAAGSSFTPAGMPHAWRAYSSLLATWRRTSPHGWSAYASHLLLGRAGVASAGAEAPMCVRRCDCCGPGAAACSGAATTTCDSPECTWGGFAV
jgi:hypothetical protein